MCKICGRSFECVDSICWRCYAKRDRTPSAAQLEAQARGFYWDPDRELCRRQRAEQSLGITIAEVGTNIYGFCVRDIMNDGGGRLSPNFKALDECLRWADAWVAADPRRRDFVHEQLVYTPKPALETPTYDAPLC